MTAAILQGAAAVRKATLGNKQAEIEREGDIGVPGVIGLGQRGLQAGQEDAADHALRVAQAAAHADRVQQIDDEIALLKEARGAVANTLALDIEIRNQENERLKVLAEQSLAQPGARDGMRAFFLDMQQQAQSTASIVYDVIEEVPRSFICSQLEFHQLLDTLWPLAEKAQREKEQRGQISQSTIM